MLEEETNGYMEREESISEQIQRNIMILDNEAKQVTEETEMKCNELATIQECNERQKQNILELQMLKENIRVKIHSEKLNQKLRFDKLAKVDNMCRDLAEYVEAAANTINKVIEAKQSATKFHVDMKNSISEHNENMEQKKMELMHGIEERKRKCEEVEHKMSGDKEEFEGVLSTYGEENDMLEKILPDMEAQLYAIRTEKHVLLALCSQMSALSTETKAEKMALESQLQNEETEYNANIQQLECTYSELFTERAINQELLKKEKEEISNLTEELWRNEENVKGLEGSLKEQIVSTEGSLQTLDNIKKDFAEKDTIVSNLQKEVEKLEAEEEELFKLKAELAATDNKVEGLQKENADLVNISKERQFEMDKLSKAKELLVADNVNKKQMNDVLEDGIRKSSLTLENLNRSFLLFQDDADKELFLLKKEDESLVQECKDIEAKTEIIENKIVSQKSINDDIGKAISCADKKLTVGKNKVFELQKSIKMQEAEHGYDQFHFDKMAATLLEYIEVINNQVEEQNRIIAETEQVKTEVLEKERQRISDLQALKESHQKQINNERDTFNQLKLDTDTALQLSAKNIKSNQSELDSETEKLKILEKNIKDADLYIQNGKRNLESHDILINKLKAKLAHVNQVAQASQLSVKSQAPVPKTIKRQYNYDSDSDSGMSVILSGELPVTSSVKKNRVIMVKDLKTFQRKVGKQISKVSK